MISGKKAVLLQTFCVLVNGIAGMEESNQKGIPNSRIKAR